VRHPFSKNLENTFRSIVLLKKILLAKKLNPRKESKAQIQCKQGIQGQDPFTMTNTPTFF